MKKEQTDRGFVVIKENNYPDRNEVRLLQESSAVGNYEDSLDNPGSSHLWVGSDFHLDRDQIKEMMTYMQYWLDNKRLPLEEDI